MNRPAPVRLETGPYGFLGAPVRPVPAEWVPRPRDRALARRPRTACRVRWRQLRRAAARARARLAAGRPLRPPPARYRARQRGPVSRAGRSPTTTGISTLLPPRMTPIRTDSPTRAPP